MLSHLISTNLSTSVRVPQDIILGKVTMGRKDNNIEDHRNSSKECLEGARVGCLKKVQEKLDHLEDTLGDVTPPPLQTNFPEFVFEF